jgi:hypothetical protein
MGSHFWLKMVVEHILQKCWMEATTSGSEAYHHLRKCYARSSPPISLSLSHWIRSIAHDMAMATTAGTTEQKNKPATKPASSSLYTLSSWPLSQFSHREYIWLEEATPTEGSKVSPGGGHRTHLKFCLAYWIASTATEVEMKI